MSGASGESLQFLIIQSQSVPAEYIVFLFEASLQAAAFFPQEPLTKHTKTSTHRVTVPASHIVNRRQTARWQMNTVTQLNTYLHFYYSYVLKFCFFVFVSVCVAVRVCACAMLKIQSRSGGYSAKLPSQCINFSSLQQISGLPLAMWKEIYFKERAESCITDMNVAITSTHLAKQSTACNPAPFTLLGFARSCEGH